MTRTYFTLGFALSLSIGCGGESSRPCLHGAVAEAGCVCEPGYTGDACDACLPSHRPEGDACVPLATTWQPYLTDQNYDRAASRITGLPAVISYAEEPLDGYPAFIGTIRHLDRPVGTCEVVPGALLGIAPALRCTWSEIYETSADPATGGDPYGYGQTYLGPASVELDPALGEVTALSIAWVWQLGAGWIEAMEARDDRATEMLYAGVEVGGAAAKPLITHRTDCEYWYDVSAALGSGPATSFSGSLTAPDGILTDSVEIVAVAGGEHIYGDAGSLRSSVDNGVVGSIDDTGAYSFSFAQAIPSGTEVRIFYRTRPPGDDPSAARYQSGGLFRRPRAAAWSTCAERPMLVSYTIRDYSSGGFDAQPAITITVGDDIACYCWDFHDGVCHDQSEGDGSGPVQFRLGSSLYDDVAAGLVHVGVDEPIYAELRIDTVNDLLELRITTPDGRYDDTVVSRSSFCDSGNSAAVRSNPNPHRGGRISDFGEPFWALPLTTIPPYAWHQVGQVRIIGATGGQALPPQGPPPGFVRR